MHGFCAESEHHGILTEWSYMDSPLYIRCILIRRFAASRKRSRKHLQAYGYQILCLRDVLHDHSEMEGPLFYVIGRNLPGRSTPD